MTYSITSEDNWLVQGLFLASFGALVFFGTTSGWLAAQFSVVQVSANMGAAVSASTAPVLVYDAYTKTAGEAKASHPTTKNTTPSILIDGLKPGQRVTGTLYVTVLPKQLTSVSKVELRLNDVVQSAKTAKAHTYVIETAPLSQGTQTASVVVWGEADGKEIQLHENIVFTVAAKNQPANKVIDKEINTAIRTPDTPMKAADQLITTDRINVRSTPNGVIITQQNAGARATLVTKAAVAQANHDWLLVEFSDGVRGYVANTYLRANDMSDQSVKPATTATQTPVDIPALQAKIAALQAQLIEIQAQLSQLLP